MRVARSWLSHEGRSSCLCEERLRDPAAPVTREHSVWSERFAISGSVSIPRWSTVSAPSTRASIPQSRHPEYCGNHPDHPTNAGPAFRLAQLGTGGIRASARDRRHRPACSTRDRRHTGPARDRRHTGPASRGTGLAAQLGTGQARDRTGARRRAGQDRRAMAATTGDGSVGQPTPQTLKALFSGPPAVTRQEVIDRTVRAISIIGSPGYPGDESEVARRPRLRRRRHRAPGGRLRRVGRPHRATPAP